MEPGTRICAIAFVMLLAPAAVFAQGAECPTSNCDTRIELRSPAPERLWLEAAAARRIKVEFVEALQRVIRAQAGTFGDEGAELQESLASMRAALTRWDAAISGIQRAAAGARAADAQVALATVLLDRLRVKEALESLARAASGDSSRADVFRLQALAYAVDGRHREAARALQRALDIDPNRPSEIYARARHLLQSNQTKEGMRALQDFQRAVERQNVSQPAGAPFERVGLLRQVGAVAPVFPDVRYAAGFAALTAGDYTAAVAELSAAAANDPLVAGDPAAREPVVRAAALLRAGQLEGALQVLQAAVAERPDHAETHRLLGLFYSIDGQPGRSIDHLRSAVRLAPSDQRARVALADVLVEERRLSEAQRELMLAIEQGGASGQVLYRLARVYERQSLLPQAAEAYRDSERFGPIVGRDHFHFAQGSLLVNQADFDGAVAAYLRRIDVNPNSGEAHRQLGEIYFLQGRHEEALAEFTAAVWLDPADARAHAAAGQAHVRLLGYAEAVSAFERALSLDPGLREARYALGTSLMRLGKPDEARAALEEFERQQAAAEALGQRDFQLDAIRRQASRELLSGGHDRAIALFSEAVTMDAQSARSHRDLGLALVRAGRPAEAVEHLTTAQQLEETAEGFAYLADAYQASGNVAEGEKHRLLYRAAVYRAKLDRIGELAR